MSVASIVWNEQWRLAERGFILVFGLERPSQSWGKLRNLDIHNLYSSPHRMRLVELRWMTWVGHVARLGEISTSRVLVGRCRGLNLVGGADVVVFVISGYETMVYSV